MQSSKNAINYEAFKENMTTQISIIINNYNYGRFLAHAIESVLQQSYPYIQLIVVDDGSNDESCEVIARYSSQLRAIFKSHGGQASALNAGFAQAHGDIIIFLDADDQLHSDAASMIVRTWAQNPGLARMHYRMDVIDQHGNEMCIRDRYSTIVWPTIQPASEVQKSESSSLKSITSWSVL